MKTLQLNHSSGHIQLAASLLKQGELVAFPTETVYGLGANIYNEQALRQIYIAKGRPQDNPVIVHISTINQLNDLTEEVSFDAQRLIDAFFPGPLTIIFPKKSTISSTISGGTDTIAIRMPKHPVALDLISTAGFPVAAPSANLSGRPSPTSAAHVLQDLNGKIAAVIDGGSCDIGIESTVIDCTTTIPTILRPGILTTAAIQKVLPQTISTQLSNTHTVHSPGMKYRHYSPDAAITIIDEHTNDQIQLNDAVVLSNKDILKTDTTIHFPLNEQSLYAAFRYADAHAIHRIIILLDEQTKQSTGLMNRIQKAVSSEA